jgi:hypothetical protein
MSKLAAVLLTMAFAAPGQTPVNFSGVWERNKSNSPATAQTPDSMRIRIDQQGPAFEVTVRAVVRGNQEQMANRYTIGQETRGEMHGAPMTSRAEWDGAELVVRSVAVIMGKELRLTDRFTLSAGGNTLTFRERHQYGAEPEGEETHVFDRRPAASWEPDAPPKPAEEVYKNIQIMKGVPAPRLRTVMMNLTKWLGVECAHCHVMGQFEKDDKPAKQTARNMFLMVRSIGQNFPGSNPVTCWTCHRGAAKPQSLPPQ